jgi:hypothetical protein
MWYPLSTKVGTNLTDERWSALELYTNKFGGTELKRVISGGMLIEKVECHYSRLYGELTGLNCIYLFAF